METEDLSSVLVRRIFLAQVVFVAGSAVLVMIAVRVDLGVFWFAFLAGVFGASVALLRRVQQGDVALVQVTNLFSDFPPIANEGRRRVTQRIDHAAL